VTLTFEPLISSTVWVTAAIVAAAMLGWYAWSRPAAIGRIRWSIIILLMAASAMLLLAVLLNPTWLERIPPPPEKPRLAILIDDSGSMASADLPDGRTRYQAASEVAEKCAARLAEGYDVEIGAFSKSLVPVNPGEVRGRRPAGAVTDLATALTSGLDSSRAAGQSVLILSDGNHNAGGGTPRVLAAAARVRALEVPVFTKTFGSDAEVHDLALRPLTPQQMSFVGQSVPVSAIVRRRGRAPGTVNVVLELDGQEIDRQTANVAEDSEVEVRFQVRQETRGLYRYHARVEPFAGETLLVNNHSTFVLRVVDEPIRVLLLEGKPYWDSKFLARTLASDPAIELVSIVRMTGTRYLQRTLKRVRGGEPAPGENRPGDAGSSAAGAKTSGFPSDVPVTESWHIMPNGANVLTEAGQLASYQVLVLGRDSESFLSDQAIDNVRQWVASDSGALVCCRGQPMGKSDERFDRLLPVQWHSSHESRFRMTLTERGRDLHWFDSSEGAKGESLPSLPALATLTPGEQPKPLANVLASASGNATVDAPAVTYQPYGGGRVVVVEGSGMWRWAFLPPAYADHDATYGALWQSLLRWLVSGAGLLPGQDMALRADQVTFGSNEPATATLLVRREVAQGPIPQIELTGDGISSPRMLVPTAAGDLPGVFRVDFGELGEGRFQARIAGQDPEKSGSSTLFDVRHLLEEQLDLKARPDLMARIASSTGAVDFTNAPTDEIVEAFKAHLERSRHERIKRTTAWDRWWVLAGTFLTWTCAWILRRSGGLV
jgi:hypothetical protein